MEIATGDDILAEVFLSDEGWYEIDGQHDLSHKEDNTGFHITTIEFYYGFGFDADRVEKVRTFFLTESIDENELELAKQRVEDINECRDGVHAEIDKDELRKTEKQIISQHLVRSWYIETGASVSEAANFELKMTDANDPSELPRLV